jgi:hypothetical protein
MSFARMALITLGIAAACQPMYMGKREKLKTPDAVARPVGSGSGAGSAVKATPKLDENCGTDRATRATSLPSRSIGEQGDKKRVEASREADAKKRAEKALEAVELYRSALAKDPYNTEATLGLAVSYDMLRRKGCALKMLSRIATLAKHQSYRDKADRSADEVKNTPQWFEHYRSDAERAVGR